MAGIVQWGEKHFKTIGSGISPSFDLSLTPYLRESIEHANDLETREVVLIKPCQSGGSTVGELALLYWLSHWARGDICYYWPSDTAADERWSKQTERKLRACKPVMAKAPLDRHKMSKGLWVMPALNLVARGAFSDRSVASDSFRGIICEETHDTDGWTPGRLAQAFTRLTGYYDSKAYIISNAGLIGSELEQHWKNGTMQYYEVLCPGCGKYHRMHMKKADDGSGLLYETPLHAEGQQPDYRKLSPTIRYHFPCGYEVKDELSIRRQLAASGKYSDPTNPNYTLAHRSYTYEAVVVPTISWLMLIKEKQTAYIARKHFGDPRLWKTYCNERECIFTSDSDRSERKPIVLNPTIKKDREGMKNRAYRFAAADFQEGVLKDHPHFWLVIFDFNAEGDGRLIFEGRCDTDGILIETIRRHEVQPQCVLVDTSYNSNHLYDLCLAQGFFAIKVVGDREFLHSDGIKRGYSEIEDLWPLGRRQYPVYSEQPELVEPGFFLISKWSAFDLLNYQMSSIKRKYEIPSDASTDFIQQMAAWTQEPHRKNAISNELEQRWTKPSERTADHMWCCCSYIAVLCDQAGIIGMPIEEKKVEEKK